MPPRKIIILRHGEKQDPFQLCSIGVQRSLALAATYLGADAKQSLFAPEEKPAAFLAITLHTVELASPSAQSWGLPLRVYSAVPISDDPLGDSRDVLDARTREALDDLLVKDLWRDQTVVLVWEHKRIADPDMKVSLYKGLGLDTLGTDVAGKQIPDKWPKTNYNFFWIVTFGDGTKTFENRPQIFTAPTYDALPQNAWDAPCVFPAGSCCES